MKKTGFTLIELLVVIAIIGLLSSVVTASLSTARGKAQNTKTVSGVLSYKNALELYYVDNGHYPQTTVDEKFCLGGSDCVLAGVTKNNSPELYNPIDPAVGLSPYFPGFPAVNDAVVKISNSEYKGAFYSCNNDVCDKPNIYWAENGTTCSRGVMDSTDGTNVFCVENISETQFVGY